MRQVLVRMPPPMIAALKADAAEHDRTIAATVRRACRNYIALGGGTDPNPARSELPPANPPDVAALTPEDEKQ